MEFYREIKENRSEGASSLLILALKKLLDFVSSQDKIYKSDIVFIISELKYVRPSMVIIRNYAEKLEFFLNDFHPNQDIKNKMESYISQLIEELLRKRREIVNKGVKILKDYKKIGVVSYSSILKEILESFTDKILVALHYDTYAKRLSGKNKILFVGEDELIENVEVGTMGADAILFLREGKFIINGYPSAKFCDILYEKPIFLFAEKEKISHSDVELEEGFEKIKFTENIKIISA
jgi:methylthioribose-1-phosphate isomerase